MGMKVDDIEKAVDFYTRLFGAEPSLVRPDYAKWMLDDPFLNFSIDLHGEGTAGSAHFGIQVTSEEELEQMRAWIDAAGLTDLLRHLSIPVTRPFNNTLGKEGLPHHSIRASNP